jgi:hypothetical protein
MKVKGIIVHSVKGKKLKRYVQPSKRNNLQGDLIRLLGMNVDYTDLNHTPSNFGVHAWIGETADGTITSVQTLPWDYRAWGCGEGINGSCNDGWIQIEICEDSLNNQEYFSKIYKEVCEVTAYLCKTFNIDPKGNILHKGIKVPTILCHQDSYKLGLGSNHKDVYHWFSKYNKDMTTMRADVAALIKESEVKKLYRVRKDKNDVKSQIGAFSLLANAKLACKNAGPNYKVYDWNWTVVYSQNKK